MSSTTANPTPTTDEGTTLAGKYHPSRHGFKFTNRYPGLPLPFRVPGLDKLKNAAYGLCGGMCFASLDYATVDQPVPDRKNAPPKGSKLHSYLFRRQLDSFGRLWWDIPRYAYWMALPDNGPKGVLCRTWDAFQAARRQLDTGEPVVLGLVKVSFRETLVLWRNHQVLAYGYKPTGEDDFTIHIYDPNLPDNDRVTLKTTRLTLGERDGAPVYGMKVAELASERPLETVRGFFTLAYSARRPPVIEEPGD